MEQQQQALMVQDSLKNELKTEVLTQKNIVENPEVSNTNNDNNEEMQTISTFN